MSLSTALVAAVTLGVSFAWLLYLLDIKILEIEEASGITGCRRIGLQGTSNLEDQYSSKYSGETSNGFTPSVTVKALYIYPIKSCAPLELSSTDIITTGFRHDRLFSFAQLLTNPASKAAGDLTVNTQRQHKWTCLTQRQKPLLSRVSTELWVPDPSSPFYSTDAEWVKNGGCLLVKIPSEPGWCRSDLGGLRNILHSLKAKLAKRDWNVEPTINFKLPLLPTAEHMREKCYTRERMQIWKDNPEAINMTSEIPPPVLAQLKYVLGVSNSLAIFRADPLKSREILRNAPRREEAGYQPSVDFADAYPIHMLGLSSVRAIHPLLPKDDARSHTPGLDALRFRANIYLTGASAFAEDHWKQIRVGDSLYHVSCRTARCALVNVDQKTGEADRQEPLKTLIEHRQIDEGARPHSCLGMQVVPLLRDPGKAESIRVGDVVEVMETGGHFYLKMFA